MLPIRLAVSAITLAVSVARHPVVRAVASNPAVRENAIKVTRNAAYNAGVLARKVVPRKRIGD